MLIRKPISKLKPGETFLGMKKTSNGNIPKFITVDGKRFNLAKRGTKSEVERYKQELKEFNTKERERSGKSWRNSYQFRIKKYSNVYAIFTK